MLDTPNLTVSAIGNPIYTNTRILVDRSNEDGGVKQDMTALWSAGVH